MNFGHSIRTPPFHFKFILIKFCCCVFGFAAEFSDLLLCFWICSEFYCCSFVFCTSGPAPRNSCTLVTHANNYKAFRALCLLTVYFVSMCAQWRGNEWERVKHVIDTGSDVNCFAFQRNNYQCYYPAWQKVTCSMNPAGHMVRLELWQMGLLLKHTLSEGEKFNPGWSLWTWWIGDSCCLTDHDIKC